MPNDLGIALVTWIATQTALTALLRTVDGDVQFYPIAAQEGKVPPVLYYTENSDASEQMQDRAPSVQNSTVSFACVGKDPPEAKAVADALYTALIEASNGGFGIQMGGVLVQAVICRNSHAPAYQWEEQQFAVDAEYKFSYTL
jgi:hypothetical protein